MLIKIVIILLFTQHIDAKNKTCNDLLRELADVEAVFTHCITVNSVPVTMCTSCKAKFDHVNEAYIALRNYTDCESKYFDKDRVNLVASTEAALNGLWTKAYCDDCHGYDEFEEKNKIFYDCYNIYGNDSCKNCMEQYLTLNNFYITLDEHNNGKVCFDIQDSMNRTRNKWSKELKCCRREFKMTLFTVALCIVTCLPFLFYGGTYLVTKRQERNHGILNDEDPLFSSSAPSSSNTTVGNLNIRSEETSTKQRKGFTTLDEDSDGDSDEENLASQNKLR